MNKLVTIVLILIFCSLNTLEAQVLKRIGNRVSNRVERTISRKIEDKAAKKTEEVIDDILEGEEKKDYISELIAASRINNASNELVTSTDPVKLLISSRMLVRFIGLRIDDRHTPK